jgi:hypothetical protein
LEGGPKSVGGDFYCDNNNLTDLKGSPEEISNNFNCGDNDITSLKGCPKKIGRNFDCYNNELSDIDFIPEWIGGSVLLDGNTIGSIFDNVDIDFLRSFKSFKVLTDGVINLKRLKYLMGLFDKFVDLKEIEYNYIIK